MSASQPSGKPLLRCSDTIHVLECQCFQKLTNTLTQEDETYGYPKHPDSKAEKRRDVLTSGVTSSNKLRWKPLKINDFSLPKLVTRHSTQHSAGQQQREVVEVLKYIHYNLSLFDGGTMGWISVESVVDYGVVGDNASCKHPLQLWSGAAK